MLTFYIIVSIILDKWQHEASLHLHNKEGEDPVAGGRQSGRGRANSQRGILRWKQPWNGQHTDSEEEIEKKQHDGRDDSARCVAVGYRTGQDRHAAHHTNNGEQH